MEGRYGGGNKVQIRRYFSNPRKDRSKIQLNEDGYKPEFERSQPSIGNRTSRAMGPDSLAHVPGEEFDK